MHHVTVFAVAVVLCNPVPASAKDSAPISLPKTSKWEMKYNPDSCQLLATFGSGKQRVIFALTREQPGDRFDLQLIGQPLKFDQIKMPVELSFGIDGKPGMHRGIAFTLDGGKLPGVRLSLQRIDGVTSGPDPKAIPAVTRVSEAAVTEVAFRRVGGKRYRLETDSMGPPLAAMRTCTDDLIKTWGYDPAVEAGLRSGPKPKTSPSTWLRSADYPNNSWHNGHNGLVRFRLDVDPSGMPSDCRVLYRTNPDEFADLTCQLLLKRARFAPALDSANKPVKTFYINEVRWLMEE